MSNLSKKGIEIEKEIRMVPFSQQAMIAIFAELAKRYLYQRFALAPLFLESLLLEIGFLVRVVTAS
jgi:hypothetical protein